MCAGLELFGLAFWVFLIVVFCWCFDVGLLSVGLGGGLNLAVGVIAFA